MAKTRTVKKTAKSKSVRAAAKPNPSPRPSESKTTPAAPLEVTITLTHDQIARRAYEIWIAKGRPLGLDLQNWAEAEAELRTAAAADI